MAEENEQRPDFWKIFREITKAIPTYTELYFVLFVQFRNFYTGANSIAGSGLTSPNSGYLREFPAELNPNSNSPHIIYKGSKDGSVTPITS